MGLAAGAALGSSLVLVSLQPERLLLPGWSRLMGWALLPVAVFLLAYSLLVELSIKETYLAPGMGSRLVRTGTYALVRHPGVLWYTLLLITLVLVTQSRLLAIALPLWVGADILWVAFQERVYLHKHFAEYVHYQRETPMLIPNRRSLSACLGSLRRARA